LTILFRKDTDNTPPLFENIYWTLFNSRLYIVFYYPCYKSSCFI